MPGSGAHCHQLCHVRHSDCKPLALKRSRTGSVFRRTRLLSATGSTKMAGVAIGHPQWDSLDSRLSHIDLTQSRPVPAGVKWLASALNAGSGGGLVQGMLRTAEPPRGSGRSEHFMDSQGTPAPSEICGLSAVDSGDLPRQVKNRAIRVGVPIFHACGFCQAYNPAARCISGTTSG